MYNMVRTDQRLFKEDKMLLIRYVYDFDYELSLTSGWYSYDSSQPPNFMVYLSFFCKIASSQ